MPTRSRSITLQRVDRAGNKEAAVVPRLEYGYSGRPGRAGKLIHAAGHVAALIV